MSTFGNDGAVEDDNWSSVILATMKSLQDQGLFQDVDIVMNDGLPLKAHSCVLSAISPEVKVLLSKSKRLDSHNISRTMWQIILDYLYTGKVACDKILTNELKDAMSRLNFKSMELVVQCLGEINCSEGIVNVSLNTDQEPVLSERTDDEDQVVIQCDKIYLEEIGEKNNSIMLQSNELNPEDDLDTDFIHLNTENVKLELKESDLSDLGDQDDHYVDIPITPRFVKIEKLATSNNFVENEELHSESSLDGVTLTALTCPFCNAFSELTDNKRFLDHLRSKHCSKNGFLKTSIQESYRNQKLWMLTLPVKPLDSFASLVGHLYICPLCSYVQTSEEKYEEHLQNVHKTNKSVIWCFVCNRKLNNIPLFVQHLWKKHELYMYKQDGAKDIQKGKYDNVDKELITSQRKGKAKRYAQIMENCKTALNVHEIHCPFCKEFVFSNMWSDLGYTQFLEHLHEVHCDSESHLHEKEYQLYIDNKLWLNLWNKYKTCVDTEKEPHIKGKVYICPICLEVFTRLGSYCSHVSEHTGGSPYVCFQCKSDHKTKIGLNQHLETHKQPMACHVCDRICSTAATLKHHLLTHRGEKHHACDQCNRTFYHKSSLQWHIRVAHLKEVEVRNYYASYTRSKICGVCGLAFKQTSALKDHEATHQSKNIICQQCGKGFTSNRLLTAHTRRIHTKEGLHKCKLCSYTNLRKYRVEEHEKKVHTKPLPHYCHKCGLGFTSKRQVQKHTCIRRDGFNDAVLDQVTQGKDDILTGEDSTIPTVIMDLEDLVVKPMMHVTDDHGKTQFYIINPPPPSEGIKTLVEGEEVAMTPPPPLDTGLEGATGHDPDGGAGDASGEYGLLADHLVHDIEHGAGVIDEDGDIVIDISGSAKEGIGGVAGGLVESMDVDQYVQYHG